jgi:hypothetical protein
MQIRKIVGWVGLMGRGKADGGANNVYGANKDFAALSFSQQRIIQHKKLSNTQKCTVHPL